MRTNIIRIALLVFFFMILTSIAVGLSSCTKNKAVEDVLNGLIGKQIILSKKSMVCLDNRQCEKSPYNDKASSYKFIIFFDSTECSSCRMKSLFEWNDYLNLEIIKQVDFYFIFATKELSYMKELYRNCNLRHSILVDTCNVFISENNFIPSQNVYHYLMLNHNNKIIFVGNIAENKKLEQIFYSILKKKIQDSHSNIN